MARAAGVSRPAPGADPERCQPRVPHPAALLEGCWHPCGGPGVRRGVEVTGTDVTIAWPAVTMSHPDLGTDPPIYVVIHNYEVVVEVELEIDGEEFTSVMHVVLPPGVREMTIPAQFIDQGEEFKYEVLAREESFNQTAVESCFVLVED